MWAHHSLSGRNMAELKCLLCQYEKYSCFLQFSVSPTELTFFSAQRCKDCTAMIWKRYLLFKLQLVIPPSWSLIVQLRAHSESHSFATLLRGQLGQSQSILNDQASVWHLQVSDCLISIITKSLASKFPYLFSQDRKKIHYSYLKSFKCLLPGFWIARSFRQKVLLKSRNSEKMGKSFDLENFPKEKKETSFLSMRRVGMMKTFAFLKGEMWVWATSETHWL